MIDPTDYLIFPKLDRARRGDTLPGLYVTRADARDTRSEAARRDTAGLQYFYAPRDEAHALPAEGPRRLNVLMRVHCPLEDGSWAVGPGNVVVLFERGDGAPVDTPALGPHRRVSRRDAVSLTAWYGSPHDLPLDHIVRRLEVEALARDRARAYPRDFPLRRVEDGRPWRLAPLRKR